MVNFKNDRLGFIKTDKMKLSYIAILLCVLISCGEDQKELELYYKFSDPEVQERFINELDSKQIYYRTDESGLVWFGAEDYSAVENIKRVIIADEYRKNSVAFPENKYVQLFKDRLDGMGIRYQSRTHSGREYVYWEDRDDSRVKKVIDEIGQIVDHDNVERIIRERNGIVR